MREIDEVSLKKWKITFAKDGIVYKTDEEYYEAINNLVGFFEILIEIDQKHKSPPVANDHVDNMCLLDQDGNKIIL